LIFLIFIILTLISIQAYAECVTFEFWAEDNSQGAFVDGKNAKAEFSVWIRLYGGSPLRRVGSVDYKYQFDGPKDTSIYRKPAYFSGSGYRVCRQSPLKFSPKPTHYEILLWENDIDRRLSYDTKRFGDDDDKIWDFSWKFNEDAIGTISFNNSAPAISNAKGVRKTKAGMWRFQLGKAYVFRSTKHSSVAWKDVLNHKGYVIIKLPQFSGHLEKA
jgi:hypothetical protein